METKNKTVFHMKNKEQNKWPNISLRGKPSTDRQTDQTKSMNFNLITEEMHFICQSIVKLNSIYIIIVEIQSNIGCEEKNK